MRCPSCGRQGPYDTANPWRPFCSEHCKTMDLGAWASERYRVESQTPPSEGQSPQDSDD